MAAKLSSDLPETDSAESEVAELDFAIDLTEIEELDPMIQFQTRFPINQPKLNVWV
jgi:hypothetical protein